MLDALNVLEDPLLDHLAHEENEGMAIASRVLSHQEWKDFDASVWAGTPAARIRVRLGSSAGPPVRSRR